MTVRKILMAAAAGAIGVLLWTSPAMAENVEIQLDPADAGKTAAEFPEFCDLPAFAGRDGFQDGWAFVTDLFQSGDALVSVELTFTSPGGLTADVTITASGATSNLPAFPEPVGKFLEGDFAVLFTPSGWTLTAGQATVTNPATKPVAKTFGVDATCAGIRNSLPLKPDNRGKTAADLPFDRGCDVPEFADKDADQDAWLFANLSSFSGDLALVGLSFKSPGGGQTADVTITTSGATSSLAAFPVKGGFFSLNEFAVLFTPAGWTLTAGQATIANSPDPWHEDDVFEVVDVCAGTPTPITTTTTTTSPGLPATGGSLTGIIAVGVVLVAGGAVTLFLMYRRRAAAGE